MKLYIIDSDNDEAYIEVKFLSFMKCLLLCLFVYYAFMFVLGICIGIVRYVI